MTAKTRRSKYPWHEWTNGEWHTIWQGADYTISTYNLQISLHGRAKVQGLKVTSRSLHDRTPDRDGLMRTRQGLTFQYYHDGE